MKNEEEIQDKSGSKRKRASTRYWREMKGRLYARLQYRDAAGRMKEKLRPISDKRTARTVVEEMRRTLNDHGSEVLENDKLTFGEFAPLYKEAKLGPAVFSNKVKVAGRKSNVVWAYDALIEYFGSTVIRAIRPRNLELFKSHRLETITKRGTKRNIATVNKELSLLRSMLTYAYQNDLILQNPFSKIKGVIAVSAEAERDRVLSFEEEFRMLAVCTGRRSHLRPILICALDTAMRSGEMLKMKWADVDFFRNEITVQQENSKTEKERKVGMTARLQTELAQLQAASTMDPESRVFGGIDSVKRAWNTACEKAGISDFRLHDCRHTATTRMIASGTPHMEVMKITGHSQLKTFLRYLNVTTDSVNTAATRLDGYLTAKRTQETTDLVSKAVN